MEITSTTKYLHAKIRTILTLLYLSFSIEDLAFTACGDSYPYRPLEHILLACGSTGKFVSLDGRNWTGDINSPYFLPSFEPKNKASSVSSAPQQASSSSEKFYLKARLSYSRFTYKFDVTAGQKFIRLYFYPTKYPNFDGSKDFFSVTAGSFTFLHNFSASITVAADPQGQDTFFKEFCINVVEKQMLNLTFIPSPDYNNAYAFINGIEVLSMPDNLYYSRLGESFEFVSQVIPYSIESRSVLETLYRLNVGGRTLSPQDDTGLYRTWYAGYMDYITDARTGVIPLNLSIEPNFISIHNYTAPVDVYRTAMSMGTDKKINENYSLTWEFPVDSGFTYFLRLHFCEFQIEITQGGNRVFQIYIANQTAESQLDIIDWSGGNGIPIYKDYAVLMGRRRNEKKQNLSVALHPAPEWRTNYSDAILNGLEIFKVGNNGNLSGPNPDPLISPSSVPQPHPQSTKTKINITTIVGVGVVGCGHVQTKSHIG